MKKRATMNFVASISYQLAAMLSGFVLPMFYLGVFGDAYNGLNQSVSQIISLLSVLQFGIAASSMRQMFPKISAEDNEGVAAIYWGAGRQYRRMGYVFVLLIFPIIFLFPFLIKDELPYWIIVIFLAFRGISAAMEYFFQAKYSVILIAHNRSYAIYVINIILLFVNTGLHLAILFTLKNIIIYQSIILLCTFLRLIIVSSYVNKKFPFLSKYKAVSKDGAGEKKERRSVLVSEIAGLAIDSTDLLVLTTFSGLISASIYSVYNFVTASLGSVISSCREAVFAGIGKTYYSDFETFKRKMSKFESVYLLLAFYLYSTAIVLFRSFVETYTLSSPEQYYYIGLPIMFICARLIINLRIPSIVAINTAGHFEQVKKYAVIEAIVNLALSVILVFPFGIYGVLMGTLVGAAIRTPILIVYANRHIIKRKSFEYWKKILRWLPVFAGGYIFSIFVTPDFSNILWWIVYAVVVAMGMLGITFAWAMLFDRETRGEIVSIAKKMKNKLTRKKNGKNRFL